MAVDIVVLAAGQGTRMGSSLPKVLHPLAGRPLLGHVLTTARTLADGNLIVVTGAGGDTVRKRLANPHIQWVEQTQQLGTGHAVLQALPALSTDSIVLILYGDVPLIASATLKALVARVKGKTLALLTVELGDPTGYGRIVRDAAGEVVGIVEQKDATQEQLAINEVNTGVLALGSDCLRQCLPSVGNDNNQHEYYLTDIIALARQQGYSIQTLRPLAAEEVQGVNTRAQLASLERYYQRRLAAQLMDSGVSLADPDRFDCRGQLSAGRDVHIDVNCVFEGQVTLGDNVRIGPNTVIRDADIGSGVVIKAHSVIEGPVRIEDGAEVGPFARLRQGTHLGEGAKIGNFVETKQAQVGPGSKINHLSYVGDAELGAGVNIGAGTITCNYDGVNKHKTVVGDGAFIGSNTSLVAPVVVGDGATVGAGSTITHDVSDHSLAVARGKQRSVDNWSRPRRKDGE